MIELLLEKMLNIILRDLELYIKNDILDII